MINQEILKDRERIKVILQRKIEGVKFICLEKKTKRGKRSIGRSRAIEMLQDVIYLIDNPDYVQVKDR